MAEHPVAWWMVGDEKLVPALSGLQLTYDERVEVTGMVNALITISTEKDK